MRILHTADWHLGQTLNGWPRAAEHAAWLDSLAEVIAREEVDALLVAGDVFDGINPSGATQALFYDALRRFKDRRPSLVTVLSAGNHDPAARLEAPSPLMAALDIHVVGHVRRDASGALDVARHMVALRDASGETRAWACAIPFLRAADLPGLSFAAGEERGSPIVEAARRFLAEMAEGARALAGDLPLVAMAHLHCHGATESEGAERRILIGGEHAVPEDAFPPVFDYVALGHLHRPQTLAGGRLRYSGSCFPLSATEAGYDHGVTLLEAGPDGLTARHLPLPRPAEMLRLPASGALPPEDLAGTLADALTALDLPDDLPVDLRPLVQVTLQATGPAAVVLAEAERLLAEAPVRPAQIRVRRPEAEAAPAAPAISLQETTPEALFRSAFLAANGTEPEARHVAAFRDAMPEG